MELLRLDEISSCQNQWCAFNCWLTDKYEVWDAGKTKCKYVKAFASGNSSNYHLANIPGKVAIKSLI